MMNRKVWIGLGACAALATSAMAQEVGESGEGGEGGAKAAASGAAENGYGATLKRDVPFATLVAKVMDGEGGEGGIGYASAGPTFTSPALTDAQIRAALVGNTVRKDQAVAIHFGKDGRVEGWKRDWTKAPSMASCPTKLGDDHEVEDGVCWIATVNPIVGPYTIKNSSVCMPAYSGKKEDGTACYYFGFTQSYVLIGDGKRMYGSGKDLVPGRELAAFLPRLRH